MYEIVCRIENEFQPKPASHILKQRKGSLSRCPGMEKESAGFGSRLELFKNLLLRA